MMMIKRLVELPGWVRVVIFLGVSSTLFATGLRAKPIPEFFVDEDKLHHIVGFAAFSFSCALAFPKIAWHWIVLGCLTAGLLIEGAQALMPLRTADPYDMLANSLGVLIGLSVAWRYGRQSTPT